MIKRKDIKKKKNKTKINVGMLAMLTVAMLLCIILGSQMLSIYQENQELEAQEESLLSQIDEQEERTEELEEQRVYVQTDKYIEEVAYSLGYVYPDEIIFKATE